eukprot:TRINITY_DN7660_c0_g1_i1.p1 TRINITY_DN7660_c0_g1~~TRINITY_DN7660_c0_g1_i1.p1  ORF type:complete len:375 (+),score=82.46 TRINITY_DN7660_c0_g1_i1:167-1291(+)
MPASSTGTTQNHLVVRIRWKGGVQRVEGLYPSNDIVFLLNKIEQFSKIPITKQKLLVGFPPKELQLKSAEQQLSTIPIVNGDTIILEQVENGGTLATVGTSTAEAKPAQAPTPAQVPAQTPTPTAQAISAEKSAAQPAPKPQPEPAKSAPTASAPKAKAPEPVEVYFGDEDGLVVRRIVKADNSCLFTSLGYVLEGHSREKGLRLRKVVADAIKADPFEYSEAFLGKPNEEYVKWIQDKDSWGGAIEVSILADYYKTEIAVISIEDLKVYIYGEGKGYNQRVALIYDNIHYDPLALTFEKNLPEEMDVTIFQPSDESVLAKARKLAEQLNKAAQFVNVSKFTLRCLVCQTGLVGQKEAVEHAKATSHTNFAEYK